MTRTAISPRLAMRTFWNTRSPCARGRKLNTGTPNRLTAMYEVRRFAELDSTNRYLLDEARAGAAEGLVAMADHQTAGRGRLGRRWEAPPGANLLVSVLLRPTLPTEELHLCTVAMALA